MKFLYNRPHLLLSLTAAFWAGNFVLGRAAAGSIPPITLASLRWGLAFVFLLPFALPYLRRDARLLIREWRILVFLGLLGPGCFNTLSYMGLVSTEALNGLVLNAAGPVFIALTARGLFGDPLSPGQLAGLAMGFAGVLTVVVKGDPAAFAALKLNPGDLLIAAAVVTWAIYTAFLRKRPAVSWESFNAVTYGVAALANLPFAIAEQAHGAGLSETWASAAIILYVAIFPSLLAYAFYNRGVELLGAARAGAYLFLIPVFGALLAMVFLGERTQPYHVAGFALIVAGVLLGSRAARIAPSAAPET